MTSDQRRLTRVSYPLSLKITDSVVSDKKVEPKGIASKTVPQDCLLEVIRKRENNRATNFRILFNSFITGSVESVWTSAATLHEPLISINNTNNINASLDYIR